VSGAPDGLTRIKVLMVDVDGVVIVHPDPKGWSARLGADLGLAPERLQSAFFAPHWDDIIHGRAALHERLAPVLAEIAPHLSAEALTNYWFREDAHLDQGLLDQLAVARAGGLRLHLATVQEHERARFLWFELGFRDRFDALHYSAAMGAAKPNRAFFETAQRRAGCTGAEIAFIDDKAANVEAAKALGWKAAVWTGQRPLAEVMAAVGVALD
jgi:putative hydrolase of the HAD superfamily